MKKNIAGLVLIVLVWIFAAPSGAVAGSMIVKEKTLREAVNGYLLDRTRDSGMEIRIKRIAISGNIDVPAGKVTYDFIAPRKWEGWGRTVLGLVVRVDDRLVRNMSVPVEVEALAEMVVALRPLQRGMVVEEGDVALQKKDMAIATGKVCFSLADVLGKRVRVPIRANTPLRADYLERIPLVKSGQVVTIIAENGSLRITATGTARGTGAEGDFIMVQNMSSKKMVQARVVDEGTVAVNF
ncbi:MAG: flagellar basal body P-ring formation chaperone FlgA [Geobacteraceae bacterium]|nr:flagellar basal body P-ring formation chaperone FlgA [Geobacteraceae bacterium]